MRQSLIGLICGLALLLFAGSAGQAQVSPFILLGDCSGTLTTAGTQQQILAAGSGRRYVLIHNPSSSNNIGVSLDGVTATIGSAGTVTLLPGGTLVFESSEIAQNAFNGVGSINTQAYTCWAQ